MEPRTTSKVLAQKTTQLVNRLADALPAIAGGKNGAGQQVPDGPILMVYNPAGGGGKARSTAKLIHQKLLSRKGLEIADPNGDVFHLQTDENPYSRIKYIIQEVERRRPTDESRRLTVVTVGGDRTVSDVAAAITSVQEKMGQKISNIALAAAGGGTISDFRRSTGASRDASEFIGFLANAKEVPLHGIKILLENLQGQQEDYFSLFGTTWGDSGEYFRRIEQLKKQGKISLATALSILPETILKSGWRYLEVERPDGITENTTSFLMTVSECGANVCHEQGVIFAFPLKANGGRFFAYPPMPGGLGPVFETLIRGLSVYFGIPHALNGGGLLALSKDRQFDLKRGRETVLKFFDKEMQPLEQYGTISGDAVGPAHTVTITEARYPVNVLASEDSGLSVRGGISKQLFSAFHFADLLNGVKPNISTASENTFRDMVMPVIKPFATYLYEPNDGLAKEALYSMANLALGFYRLMPSIVR